MKTEPIQSIQDAWKQILPPSTKHQTLEMGDYLTHLTSEEVLFLEKASARRQKEFATSRFAIRNLLSGKEATSIVQTDKGAPVWPEGFIGSISHTKGICSVVIDSTTRLQGIGIDLETRNRVQEKIWKKIASETEIQSAKAFSEARGIDMQDTMEILFSAKEATYKYQYPQTKTWIGFLEAEVIFDVESDSIGIRMTDNQHIAFDLCKKATLRFALTNEHILSVAYLKK